MTERIPCTTEGCKATIQPTTATKTGGYCMPCHHEQERQERQAYIKKHRRTVNLYKNLTDPVDVLKVMHAPIQYDPLIQYVPYPMSKEQVYVSLTAEEAEHMLKYALDLLSAGDESDAEDILLSLVCYRNDNIAETLSMLMEHDMYHASVLFKDAPPEIRDRLMQKVEWDDDNRNHILLILSWIGDPVVVGQFREWQLHPPEWAEQLHVLPERYTLEAGWELTPDGEKQDLIHSLSYAIRATGEQHEKDSEAEPSAARFLDTSSSACPWCEGKLTTLMDVKTSHPSLTYLSLPMDRLRIETCERCGCYDTIFMELDRDGVPVWSQFNEKPEYLPCLDSEDNPDVTAPKLSLSSETQSPFYAAVWSLSQQNSQIGGHPSWVQDANYPVCPRCAKRMRFIGQVDWADCYEFGEGIYYIFICTEDTLTAALYQQS